MPDSNGLLYKNIYFLIIIIITKYDYMCIEVFIRVVTGCGYASTRSGTKLAHNTHSIRQSPSRRPFSFFSYIFFIYWFYYNVFGTDSIIIHFSWIIFASYTIHICKLRTRSTDWGGQHQHTTPLTHSFTFQFALIVQLTLFKEILRRLFLLL